MAWRRKLVVGCSTLTILGAWSFLSLLGLSGCSLTFHDRSYFVASDGHPEWAWVERDGVEVAYGVTPKVHAEYMWGFPFVTFGEDTDTHYVLLHVSTNKSGFDQSARIVRAEIVSASTTLVVPLVPNTAFEPEVSDGWQKMRVIDEYYSPNKVEALYFVEDGWHIPPSIGEFRFVVQIRIQNGDSARTMMFESKFRRVTEKRPAYVSHPHAW